MSETRPRFQFGLRKLLLWTAILMSVRFCVPPLVENWREATLLAAALGAVYGYAVFAFSEVVSVGIDSLDRRVGARAERGNPDGRETQAPDS